MGYLRKQRNGTRGKDGSKRPATSSAPATTAKTGDMTKGDAFLEKLRHGPRLPMDSGPPPVIVIDTPDD